MMGNSGRQSGRGPATERKAIIDQGLELLQAGHLGKAQAAARHVLASDPHHPDANHLLGLVAHRTGHLQDAVTLLEKAVAAQPSNAIFHGNLGVVYKALSRDEDAERSYRRALKLAPDVAALYNNLGVALQAQNRHAEAREAFEHALGLEPAFAGAHNNLALSLCVLEQPSLAAQHARQAIRLNAGYLAAFLTLARACLDIDRKDEANAALQAAKALKPDANVLTQMGRLYTRLDDTDNARDCFERAVALNPALADAHFNLGVIASGEGHTEKAVDSFRRALDLDPAIPGLLRNLGDSLAALGRIDEATEVLRRQIAQDPGDGASYRSLAGIVRISEGDRDGELIENAYRASEPGSRNRMHLGFAVAKVREDTGHYPEALEALIEANALRRRDFDYRPDDIARGFERTRTIVDAPFVARYRDAGFKDPTPIFILGMPRSGTTLTEQILASHSRVHGAGELSWFKKLSFMGGLIEDDELAARSLSTTTPETFEALGKDYVSLLRQLAPDTPFITDKMPGNFRYVGLIHLALPQSKIIHVRRDPADNCLSIFKNFFSGDGHGYAYDLAELGRYHNLYRRLMAHWREVLPEGRMFELDYEALIADQEGESRKLLAYCGLGWEDAVLEFHKADRTVKTASRAQVRQPIYKSSIRLAERYGDGLKPLLDALAEARP